MPPDVTESEFKKLKAGMTYSEVVAIIGINGGLVEKDDIGGVTTKEIFEWKNSDGSSAIITFRDSRITKKNQTRLH